MKTKEMKIVKYESYLTPDTHVRIQDGNGKLGKGIYTVNLLAGDEPLTLSNGTQLTNIPGTCGGCCKECKGNCYAIRTQLFRNKNVPMWASNTILAIQEIDTFFKEIQQFIDCSIVSAIRFHAFGEIPSYEYLEHMVELAKRNNDIKFYTYTKRFKWIEEYLKENDSFPSNLVINVSIWNKNYDNHYDLPEFIYDDGTDQDLKYVKHCPAIDKDGHETGITCAKCKMCLKAKNGNKIAVYAH